MFFTVSLLQIIYIMKNRLIIFLAFLSFNACNSKSTENQLKVNEEINKYLINLNDTLKNYQKPILLYLSTDWCRGCKHVDSTHMNDEVFISTVNQNFQFYKIDGDLPYEFQLADTTYILQESMNDFMLTFFEPSGMASYPSFMIIKQDKNVEAVTAPTFVQDSEEMAELLVSISKE